MTPIHFGKRRRVTKLFGYNYEERREGALTFVSKNQVTQADI